jgi:hypothetical protein
MVGGFEFKKDSRSLLCPSDWVTSYIRRVGTGDFLNSSIRSVSGTGSIMSSRLNRIGRDVTNA